MVDPELLKILACPYCVTRPEPAPKGTVKGELEAKPGAEALKCKQCGREYHAEGGILNLLIEEATLPEDAAS